MSRCFRPGPDSSRWRTQDADGAELRQQLRQAARLWNDRGRSDDLLWSGTSYRDFSLWRERNTSELSGTEAAFADAAIRRNTRQRRRRRVAMVAAFAAVVTVAVGASALYRNADRARARAEAETRRAEAGRLLVLAQRDLDSHPTGALAFALKSLELADTAAGRLLAVQVLQQSPVARIAPIDSQTAIVRTFSPDGEWMATSGFDRVSLFNRNGDKPRTIIQYPSVGVALVGINFPSPDMLVSILRGDLRLWSIKEAREQARVQIDATYSHLTGAGLLIERKTDAAGRHMKMGLWPYDRLRGEAAMSPIETPDDDALGGGWLATLYGHELLLKSLTDLGALPRKLTGAPGEVAEMAMSDSGTRLAAIDRSGTIAVWTIQSSRGVPERVLKSPALSSIALDRPGRHLAVSTYVDGRPTVHVFDLSEPPGIEPVVITRGESQGHSNPPVFDPSGQWVSTSSGSDIEMWSIGGPRPRTFAFGNATSLDFTPDGRSLLAATGGGVRAFPMSASDELKMVLPVESNWANVVAADPSGHRAAMGLNRGRLLLFDLQSGETRTLSGFSERTAMGV